MKEGYAQFDPNANDSEINEIFIRYDANKDGKLDIEEFSKGLKEIEEKDKEG